MLNFTLSYKYFYFYFLIIEKKKDNGLDGEEANEWKQDKNEKGQWRDACKSKGRGWVTVLLTD